MTVVVRRSALRMWLLAMAGIPLLVLSLDVITNRRLTNQLRDLLFRPEDTQIFEPRDVIWAWAMAVFAGFLVLWGLKELFVPTKVLECRPEGLALKLNGPFRPVTVVPWEVIVDVDGMEMEDETGRVPMFWLEVADRSALPANPWGARWTGPATMVVVAQDWTEPPRDVAEKVADYAVDEAKAARRRAVASIWQEGEEE
ncbi:MAG: hypothetical protein L0Z63_06400 [Actinobacteria bacterium]|nr:hypothetical protein [Actinomycetota bacterium]